MTRRIAALLFVALAMSCWTAGQVRAQGMPGMETPRKATISAMGTVQVQRQPTTLRMNLQLLAKGKTLEEALEKLKTRRQAAAKQLQSLEADKASISFSPPAVFTAQNQQQRQLEAMVRERMGHGKKAAKPIKPAVTVSTLLTAQWPLAADSPEKLLLVVEALREKIKSADLAGVKETEKLSPEEQELAEEAAAAEAEQSGRLPGGEEAPQAGQPHFLYVARISEADRDKAMADAFRKAKANAALLAKAAGVPLGPLCGLTGRSNDSSFVDEESPWAQSAGPEAMYIQRMMMRRNAAAPDDQSLEVVGPSPASLSFDFSVQAMFALETGK
jgi:uncharacterized protein YggE